MAEYADVNYWNERYTKDEKTFEWYQGYVGIQKVLRLHLVPNKTILVPGCGNSSLSEEIYINDCKNVTSVDFSPVVINQMKQKYINKPAMAWVAADVTKLPMEDASFDIIVDKGCVDSLLCGETSEDAAVATLREYYRVLKPAGVCIIVSFGSPDLRQHLLESAEFKWQLHPVTNIAKPSLNLADYTNSSQGVPAVPKVTEGADCHYVYTCIKHG